MKKSKLLTSIIIAMLLVSLHPSAVHAAETGEGTEDVTGAPYFVIESTADGKTDGFPLKATSVTANINGTIAETYVTQTYKNEGETTINASYVFPASTKVSIHGMKMLIGDKVVTAKIKEREEAAAEFEEAKEEGKSASLLSQERPNLFTMHVANIMPGDEVAIELHYTELIVSTDGTSQFVFPTVAGPRYVSPSDDESDGQGEATAVPYLREDTAPEGTYDITVNLSAGVPISALMSKSHEIVIEQENDSTAKITLANKADYAGNRDFILDYRLTGEKVNSGLILNKGKSENFFMLSVQPPNRVIPEDIPPREYIFVLDVSGSMYGYPIDTAKKLIRTLVQNLEETDTFNLILFSGGSLQMADQSVPATEENVNIALAMIDREDSGGGTELSPALESALALPRTADVSRSVVVISDGFIYGESKVFDLISDNLHTTDFFSFGIGSSVNRYLIEGIAKAGQGEAFIVTDEADAADTAERFGTYIQSPILTDIKVTYNGFDAYDIEPKALPTLFAQRPIVLFGKWRGEPGGTIQITGKSGSGDFSQTIDVAELAPSTGNDAIQYLWARTKVDRLMDYGNSTDAEYTVRPEVTKLGLDYSMMTPYTSFIAVVETVRNTNGSTDVKQPSPLPQGVSEYAIGFTTGSEPGNMLLLLALLAAISINLFVKHKKKDSDNTMRISP